MKEQNKENKEEVINHETLFVGLNEAAMVAYVDAERRKEYGTMPDASDCPTNDEMFLRLQATLLRAWEADKKNKRIDFLRVKYDYENSLEARNLYRERIRGTFEYELTETVRQLLGFCFSLHIDVENYMREIYKFNNIKALLNYEELQLDKR